MKIYVKREKNDWSLTEQVTKELASIKHLRESVRVGELPFLGKVEVSEGSFEWDGKENYISQDPPRNEIKKNTVGEIINIIGWLTIIGGVISGLIQIPDKENVLAYMFSGIITGCLFIGFSEVIQLLTRIDSKLK
ncbi:hypothetical protein E5161_07485 [Cohnella pontilimi]|uniref:Uncharacterized protein n=1 Tax=Cohnella pontilimi TaxID=2564100 RepID=A0A4U0FEF2_9BACL|nr:hypothetical protein [Cohnella pontilimi]TJY42684.1 hypothetical protein E5161_07485 [Cohnella pontilimi]